MSKFKIGDRVRAIGMIDHVNLTGMTGMVVSFGAGSHNIGVQFDDQFSDGHRCNGASFYGRGRYAAKFELEFEENYNMKDNIKAMFSRVYKVKNE